MESEEKLKKIQEETEKQRDKVIRDIFYDIPIQNILQQPGLAAQMIIVLRACLSNLKMLDENYEFKFDNLPGFVNGKPAYIG